MTTTNDFIDWKLVNPKLAELAVEANDLRDIGKTAEDETLDQLHQRLVRARSNQDRLESIVAELGRLRSRARVKTAEAQDAYDDKWREVMNATKIGEYSSAKEREGIYATGAINQLIALRSAKRTQADVEEVYEYCLLKYRGLDAARREVDSRVRLINVQGMLES